MEENITKEVLKVGEQILNVLDQGGNEVLEPKNKSSKKKSMSGNGICDDNKAKTIKIRTWAVAFALIVLQVIFLKWWTILTGVVTAFAAYYVAEVLVKKDELLEELHEFVMENMVDCIVWVIAVILIIVQVFALGWWTLLTGPCTILVTFLLQKLFGKVSEYLNE